jgi:hypothetical protein
VPVGDHRCNGGHCQICTYRDVSAGAVIGGQLAASLFGARGGGTTPAATATAMRELLLACVCDMGEGCMHETHPARQKSRRVRPRRAHARRHHHHAEAAGACGPVAPGRCRW